MQSKNVLRNVRDCKYLKALKKELKDLNAVFDGVKMENQPLTSRITQLESEIKEAKTDIEQETYSKVMGDIKPGCWVNVKTKDGEKFIGYFHSYGERDGYELPIFIATHTEDRLEYKYIEQIKKVKQKVATVYIKRG